MKKKKEYDGDYRFYYYSGDFTKNKYYKKVALFATLLVLVIILGSVLMLSMDSAWPLVISLVAFVVALVWFIVYNNYFVKALCSVFVLDTDNSLWYITVMPSRSYYSNGASLPDVESAVCSAMDKNYIASVVDGIKNGTDKYSIWSGGNQYQRLTNCSVAKETKKFMYIDAVASSRKYTEKKKVIKVVKPYENVKENFASVYS